MDKITKRTENRIEAIKVIYEALMGDVSIDEVISRKECFEKEVLDFLELVTKNDEKITELIKENLKNYSINRLNILDLAIIKLAVAELLEKKTPKAIVINEALNITKIYTNVEGNNQVKFNNRLLDNICKSLGL